MMDKFELKILLIETLDTLMSCGSKIISPGCVDEETGEMRSKAFNELEKTYKVIKEIAYNIY